MLILKNGAEDSEKYHGNINGLIITSRIIGNAVNVPCGAVPAYANCMIELKHTDLSGKTNIVYSGDLLTFLNFFQTKHVLSERYSYLKAVSGTVWVLQTAALKNERRANLSVNFEALSGDFELTVRNQTVFPAESSIDSHLQIAFDVTTDLSTFDWRLDVTSVPVTSAKTVSYDGHVRGLCMLCNDCFYGAAPVSFINTVSINSKFSDGIFTGDELALRQLAPHNIDRGSTSLSLMDVEFVQNPTVNLQLYNSSMSNAKSYSLVAQICTPNEMLFKRQPVNPLFHKTDAYFSGQLG